MNGQTINIGDTDYRFGIESVSKVHTAILILRQYGAQKSAGYDWRRCNRTAVQLYHCHFAGKRPSLYAVGKCRRYLRLLHGTAGGNPDKKWDAIVQNITELCGSAPQLIDELYKSETATNFNNRSIAWLLKNYNRIYDDPDMALDLYTRQCSLGITAQQLGIAAGTIANNGVNPVTKQTVFEASLAPKITSMNFYRSFYEHSGVTGCTPGQYGHYAAAHTAFGRYAGGVHPVA